MTYLNYQPRRGDDVDQWLKHYRDVWEANCGRTDEWYVMDDLLEAYRLHADTGTKLNQDVSITQQPLVERMEPIQC